MLSAKKVKLHGMSDSRWTVKDKLTQFKGLINLYTRDNKILQFDASVARKQQVSSLKKLTRSIVTSRKDLDDAVSGNRQNLRNSLQEHRDLQLAFQHLDPEKVVENIHQSNFNKRKELDKLKFTMKKKREQLIDVKMRLAALEDRETYKDMYDQLPTEKQAEIVTGKVQNALLRQEAAITVRYTYKNILEILKKDSYYFDAVLEALRKDLHMQSNCLYRTTELGQMATEYSDDRRSELKALEAAVKKDREIKMKSLEIVTEQVKTITNNVKQLIRRDSDFNIPAKGLKKTKSDEILMDNIKEFELILNSLQQVLMVPNFEALYPCLVTQKKNKEDLESLVKTLKEACTSLQNKKNHAEIKLNNLIYSMVDSTLEYMERKKFIQEEINAKKEHLQNIRDEIFKRGNVSVQIRASLQQIKYLLTPVVTEFDKTKSKQITIVSPADAPVDDVDEKTLLAILRAKLTILSAAATGELLGKARNDAEKYFMDMVVQGSKTISITEDVFIEDLLASVVIEDASILSRADVKRISKELVDYNLQLEAELFAPQPPKKKR